MSNEKKNAEQNKEITLESLEEVAGGAVGSFEGWKLKIGGSYPEKAAGGDSPTKPATEA